MRPPEDIDVVPWASFQGSADYRPERVKPALQAIANADDEASMRRAVSSCLFAVGNNHRGTLSPPAPQLVPFLVWFVAHGTTWPRRAALEVLLDAALFHDDEPKHGDPSSIREAFHAAVRLEAEHLVGLTKDSTENADTRRLAKEVLEEVRLLPPE